MTYKTTATLISATVTLTGTVAEWQEFDRIAAYAAYVLDNHGMRDHYIDKIAHHYLDLIQRMATDVEYMNAITHFCKVTHFCKAPTTDDGDAAPGAPRYPYDNGDGDGS